MPGMVDIDINASWAGGVALSVVIATCDSLPECKSVQWKPWQGYNSEFALVWAAAVKLPGMCQGVSRTGLYV